MNGGAVVCATPVVGRRAGWPAGTDHQPGNDPEQEYDDAGRASLDEGASGPLDGIGNPAGRGHTGSDHPEASPTGDTGLSDRSVADDPDRG
ncbi:hypothetical protein [Saccharothrix lopnurensis]|uniref:Uncharacterized protein n=1 Tax=Saccharothrix lopnurensis TaxID=1670621 RepID=A0ABW1P6A7_9PSEU